MLRYLASFLVSLCVLLGPALAQETALALGEETEPRSSLDLLLDVIEDDAARTELIERLRSAGPADSPARTVVETLAPGAPPPEDMSLGRQVA